MCSLVGQLQRCQFLSNCSASLYGQHIPFNRPNKVKIASRQKERKGDTNETNTAHSLVMISWEVSVGCWLLAPLPSSCLNPNLCANNDEAAAWCRRPSSVARCSWLNAFLSHCCCLWPFFRAPTLRLSGLHWPKPRCQVAVMHSERGRQWQTTLWLDNVQPNSTQIGFGQRKSPRRKKGFYTINFDPLILPFRRASIMNCKRSHVSAHDYRWMSHAAS